MTCTKEQIKKLMRYANSYTQEAAAAKAGMSIRTARKYIGLGGKREEPVRDWKTHKDNFAGVWTELTEMLKNDQMLEAKTLMEWLVERYPDRFQSGQLRTLQRRIRDWRALEGPEREVIFPQIHIPGKQSQSDYTNCNELGVTIDGKSFPHLLFHFMLPYSRWETVSIAYSESFQSLTEGYMKAVRELGGAVAEHRTDNLTAAIKLDGGRKKFNSRWIDFLNHYGVIPTTNNPGESHENGSVEKSHDLFKKAIDQRLRLRGSRNFGSKDAYEEFLKDVLKRRNRDRKEKLNEELPLLKELANRDWSDPSEYTVSVGRASTVVIQRATYSVPSRLIGRILRALVYSDKIQLYFGNKLVQEMLRQKAGGESINYRHIINHLVRKPGAFAGYRHREALYPSAVFRKAYDKLCNGSLERGEKEYLQVLKLAALGSESDVAIALELLLDEDIAPIAAKVAELCAIRKEPPLVQVQDINAHVYDHLLINAEALGGISA